MDGRNSQQSLIYYMTFQASEPVKSMAKQSQQSKSFFKAHHLCTGFALWLAPLAVTRWPSQFLPHSHLGQCPESERKPLLASPVQKASLWAPGRSRHMCQNWVPRPPQKHLFRRVTSLWWAETRQEWPLALGIWSPLPPKLCEDKSEALLAVKKRSCLGVPPSQSFSAWSADKGG